MTSELKTRQGLRLQGFIEIEKVNKKDHVVERYHNTITPGGKQFILAKSVGEMLAMSASPYGDIDSIQGLTLNYPNNNHYNYRLCKDDQVITNALLNLDSDVLEGLGASTDFINIWNSDFTEASKVTGYANNNVSPLDVVKEGKIDYCKPDYMTDGLTVAKRWYYPVGVATGTINCIAMMPGDMVKYIPGRGIRFRRGIDKVNTQDTNYANLSTGFCPPGIPGITGNTEILLNYGQNGITKHKYNFATGIMTDLGSSDPWLCIESVVSSRTVVDMLYDSTKMVLYVLRESGYSYYLDSYKIVGDGTYTQLNNLTSIGYTGSSNYACISGKLVLVNGELYQSALRDVVHTSSSGNKFWKLVRDSDGKVTSYTDAAADFSGISLTLPSGFNALACGLGMYKGNYCLYVPNFRKATVQGSLQIIYANTYNQADCLTGFVFTDLSDFAGSIVDIIPSLSWRSIPYNAGSYSGFIELGKILANYYNQTTNASTFYRAIQNNTAKTNTNSIIFNENNGIYLTQDKEWATLISFVKLTTPITKTATDELYVTYGYTIT